MEKAIVRFRMDARLKAAMEGTCRNLGISMEDAFTAFAEIAVREQRIPFEMSCDQFYSWENMRHLDKVLADANAGRNMSLHDLIEAGD